MNIFITGTSSGIGHALARTYLEKGASVYGISRRFSPEMKQFSAYHHLSLDLKDIYEIEGQVKKLLKEVDVLDQVVLNAGMLPEISDMRSTSMKEIRTVMNVNVWANKMILDTLSRAVDQVHQVAAISSGASVSASRGWNVYSISKAALNSMIRLYAGELPDIHFSSIAPGIVETEMQDFIYEHRNETQFDVIRRLSEMKENKRMSDPFETALLLIEAMGLVLQLESGLYHDIRSLLQVSS